MEKADRAALAGRVAGSVAAAALWFLLAAGMWALVCGGFGLEWSWRSSAGVWALCCLARWVLSAARPGGPAATVRNRV